MCCVSFIVIASPFSSARSVPILRTLNRSSLSITPDLTSPRANFGHFQSLVRGEMMVGCSPRGFAWWMGKPMNLWRCSIQRLSVRR